MTELHEPSELKKAEAWLRQKAERILSKIHPDWDEEEDAQTVEAILFQLKVAYSEGYADRIKAEASEAVSPPPKRRVQRKKK